MAYYGGGNPHTGYSDVVTYQPGNRVNIEAPPMSETGPNFEGRIGLELLDPLDSVTIKHRSPSDWAMWNKYQVYDKEGRLIFNVDEEPGNEHTRTYYGPNRGFLVKITDVYQYPLLYLKRDFKLCVGWCCADGRCYWPVQVYGEDMVKIGMLRMRQGCCNLANGAYDNLDNCMYNISFDLCRCGDHIQFPVSNVQTGARVGNIGKHNPGSETSTYVVEFPRNMDRLSKILIFCSVFQIEFTLYGNEVAGEWYVQKTSIGRRYVP